MAIMRIHPHFVYTQEESDAFINGQFSGPGELTHELVTSAGYAKLKTKCIGIGETVHEYLWGIVTEHTKSTGCEWNIFIADAWRNGNAMILENHLEGWEENSVDPIEQLLRSTPTGFILNMKDPRCQKGAATLGCRNKTEALALSRYWLANLFIPGVLPDVATRAIQAARHAQYAKPQRSVRRATPSQTNQRESL